MQIGIIGCGKMGSAWVEGAIRVGAMAAADVVGIDPSPVAREHFSQATGTRTTAEPAALAGCEVVLLCTKPAAVQSALHDLAAVCGDQPVLVISIAAGITLAAMEAAVPPTVRIIRAMPNTAVLVGRGAAGYCLGSRATPADAAVAARLLGAVGLAVEVPERLMNAVTGLSGSGPAYIYLVIEALADGGVQAGLPRAEALQLAAQTVLGSAAMVLETGTHPAVLKDMVTSPAGTTLAGLAELERQGLRSALIDAVTAATARAAQLGG